MLEEESIPQHTDSREEGEGEEQEEERLRSHEKQQEEAAVCPRGRERDQEGDRDRTSVAEEGRHRSRGKGERRSPSRSLERSPHRHRSQRTADSRRHRSGEGWHTRYQPRAYRDEHGRGRDEVGPSRHYDRDRVSSGYARERGEPGPDRSSSRGVQYEKDRRPSYDSRAERDRDHRRGWSRPGGGDEGHEDGERVKIRRRGEWEGSGGEVDQRRKSSFGGSTDETSGAASSSRYRGGYRHHGEVDDRPLENRLPRVWRDRDDYGANRLKERERKRKRDEADTEKKKIQASMRDELPTTPNAAAAEPRMLMEITVNDRLGKKARIKCCKDDTILDVKKLAAAILGTRPEKMKFQKQHVVLKDHIDLDTYEIKHGMNIELYYN